MLFWQNTFDLFIDVVLANLVDITSSLLVITTMRMTIIYLIDSIA